MHDRPVRLILVRHGITTWNKDSRYQGHTDVPLSEDGVLQAKRAGKRLSGYSIDRVYSSDLSRARQTAEIIGQHCGIPVNLDTKLREMCFGDWEGLTYDEIAQRWPDEQKAWLKDPVNLCPPAGETAAQLGERLKLALSDIYAELSSLSTGERQPCCVVVAHGGVIRALMSYATTGKMTDMWGRGVRQASLTNCDLCGEALTLIDCDDVSHLDSEDSPDKLSRSIQH